MSPFPARCRFDPRHGFTLVEILAVLGIMTIMMTLTVPATRSIIQSYQIKQTGLMFQGKLAEAKQTAFGMNRPVQIRLSGSASSTTTPYQTVQIFSIEADGTPSPLGRAMSLPQGVCIASTTTYSSVMALNEQTANSSDPSIGAMGKSYAYRKFTIYPSGVTDLSPDSKWFVTVTDERSNASGTRPANFATIQIDPVNGISSLYNP